MRCSNCGKDIPFGGNVCPFCHVDKSGDQAMTVIAFIFSIAGAAICGSIWGCSGTVWGLIGGMVVGVIIGASFGASMKKKTTAAGKAYPINPQPPVVVPPPQTTASQIVATHFFVVIGVEKATGRDTQIRISAATAGNAKVKAELQGIVVTEVLEE